MADACRDAGAAAEGQTREAATAWTASSTRSSWIAAIFVGIVAADVFISVLLRYFFSIQIPDSYDFGQLLLGILIFWGIAATSYRGTHITVDLRLGQCRPAAGSASSTCSPRWCCCSSSSVQTYTLFDKVAQHPRRQRADLRPAAAGLAVLRGRLDRRRLGRAADRGAHLSADLPSRADGPSAPTDQAGRVRPTR